MSWTKLRRKTPTWQHEHVLFGKPYFFLLREEKGGYWSIEMFGCKFGVEDSEERGLADAKRLAMREIERELFDRTLAAWERWSDESDEKADIWIRGLENASEDFDRDDPEFYPLAMETAEFLAEDEGVDLPSQEERLADWRKERS